jgi:hypothetical protein
MSNLDIECWRSVWALHSGGVPTREKWHIRGLTQTMTEQMMTEQIAQADSRIGFQPRHWSWH